MAIRGHGGAYVVESLSLPITPTPATGSRFFHDDGLVTTAAFVKVDLKGGKNTIKLTETGGAQSFEYSFDGTNAHGTVAASGTVTFDHMFIESVWIRDGSGSATVTVDAWVGGEQ